MSLYRRATEAIKNTPLYQRMMLAQVGALSPALAYVAGSPESQVQAYYATPLARVVTVAGFGGGTLVGFTRGLLGRENRPSTGFRERRHRESQQDAIDAGARLRANADANIEDLGGRYETAAAEWRRMGIWDEAGIQANLEAQKAGLERLRTDTYQRADALVADSERRLREFAPTVQLPRKKALARGARAAAGVLSAAGTYAMTKDPELTAAALAEGYAASYAAEMGQDLGHGAGAKVRQAFTRPRGKPQPQFGPPARTVTRGGFGVRA